VVVREVDCGGTVADPELAENAADMGLHRGFGYLQLSCDLSVRCAEAISLRTSSSRSDRRSSRAESRTAGATTAGSDPAPAARHLDRTRHHTPAAFPLPAKQRLRGQGTFHPGVGDFL